MRGHLRSWGLAAALWLAIGPAVSPVGGAEPGDRQRILLRGLEQFEAARTPAEYRRSAETLEGAFRDGYRNGAAYYNLGNAWFRAGEFGRAIAAYRRAKPFRPRDPYLEANLRQALQRAPGRLPEPSPDWWRQVVFWHDWLSYPEKGSAVLLLLVGAAGLWGAGLFWRPTALRWGWGGLLVVGSLLAADLGLTHFEVEWSRRGVVAGETVARKGIGDGYEPAFDQPLQDGAEFTILQTSGEWVFGQFAGIGDGWLRAEFVAR